MNLTDLVKKMSISEGLNAGAFGEEMSSNQFRTDGRSLQLDETLLEENNVDKALGTSKIVDDGAPAVRGRLAQIEPGKRKGKPTEHWLAYKTSQLEEEEENRTPGYSGNQVHWMSSYIQSEMLRLLGSICSSLMECSRY